MSNVQKLSNAASAWTRYVEKSNLPCTSAFINTREQVSFLPSDEMSISKNGKDAKALWTVLVDRSGNVKNVVKYSKKSGLRGMFNNIASAFLNTVEGISGISRIDSNNEIINQADRILGEISASQAAYSFTARTNNLSDLIKRFS